MAGILGDRTASAQNARAYDLYGSRPVDVVVATNPATEAEKKVWLAVALLAKERAAFEVEKAAARLEDATAEYERVQALPVTPQLVRREQPVNEVTALLGAGRYDKTAGELLDAERAERAATGDTGSGYQ